MANININSNVGQIIGQFQQLSSLLTGGVSKALATVRSGFTALAANPVGAIVTAVSVAIVAVTAALSKFQPAIDRANQAFAAANAVVDVFVDRLQNVGVILGELLSGNLSFGDALDQLSESFSGVTEEIVREATAARDLEAATQALEEREIALLTVQAELRVASREALLASADQNRSIEERIELLGEAETAIRQQFANERAVAEERTRILREQVALGNSTREERRELEELEANLILLRADEATQLKEISGVRSGLLRTEQMQAQVRADQLRELEQGREIELLEAQGATEEELYQARLERAETEAEREQLMHDERIRLLTEETQARKEAEQERLENEAAAAEDAAAIEAERIATLEELEAGYNQSRRDLAAQLGDTLQLLAGENKAVAIAGLLIEQGAAVAGIISNTALANAKAVSASPLTAGQPFVGINTASAALSIASVVAETAKGIQQINSSGAGGAVSGAAGGGGATSIPFGPTVATPNIGEDETTGVDIGSTTPEAPQTVMAVVEQGAVSNANEREARLNNRRRITGS